MLFGWLSLMGCSHGGTAGKPPEVEGTLPTSAVSSEPDAPPSLTARAELGSAGNAEPASSEAATEAEPVQAPAVALSPVHQELASMAELIDRGQLSQAKTSLLPLVARLDRDGPLDERIVAHALKGRLHERGRNEPAARVEYGKVLELWRDPAVASASVGPGEAEAVRYVRLARALGAVGEAVFHGAEQKRREADAVRFPAYQGGSGAPAPRKAIEEMSEKEFQREMQRRQAQTESVRKHIEGPVRQWIEGKQRVLEETEKGYLRVLDIQPAPPPQWVVASAARVGEMWEAFAEDFDKAPLPGWMKDDPVVMQGYRSALEAATEPLRARARAAFETCASMARRYRVQSEHSTLCAQRVGASGP